MERERVGRVGEGRHRVEAVTRPDRRHLRQAELPAHLRQDHLAGGQAEAPALLGQVDHRGTQEARVDLDALAALVPVGDVLDGVEVEPGAEVAIHPPEQVACEGGAHARGVVVGRLERGDVLHQVEAQEQVVAGREGVGDALEEGRGVDAIEVAEAAAEEEEHQRRELVQARERLLVGPRERAHVEHRELGVQRGRRCLEHVTADVDRDVARGLAAGGPGAQDVPRLGGAAGPELDDACSGRWRRGARRRGARAGRPRCG